MAAPYISRPETDAFLAAFQAALTEPSSPPIVFHAWGIGGVGKTTLVKQAKTIKTDQGIQGQFAEVSFGLTEQVDEPIPLMATLYQQLQPQDNWVRDPFWDCYNRYFETINALEIRPASGRGAVGETQVAQVKQLLKLGVDVAGEWSRSETLKETGGALVERGMDAAVSLLSLKDFLQQHRVTKDEMELQKILLDPLRYLTQAFVEGLAAQSKRAPVVVVLDTYEKVPPMVDTWLWRAVLGNTTIGDHPIRLMVMGRKALVKTEGWRKLQQDRGILFERTIDKFEEPQTRQYLTAIGYTDESEMTSIYGVTKGLPYYLDWIRRQREQGRQLNFSQGNQEIVRLLLQGLNDTQKHLVQLAACCRQFDQRLIRLLTDADGMDFATAVDEERNCFGWLVQLSFVEPVKGQFRLDDVVRDVFHQAFWLADADQWEEVHRTLASGFQERSNREVPVDAPPPAKYKNPDWCDLRVDYLYHLTLSRDTDAQKQLLTHLLEGYYLQRNQSKIASLALTALEADFITWDRTPLGYGLRTFCQDIRPAALHGWALFEETPIDYAYNLDKYGLDKITTDRAISCCLKPTNTLEGLAKFAALFYSFNRCLPHQQSAMLERAAEQAKNISTKDDPDFSSDLFCYDLGNSFADVKAYEKAIASYDKAIEFKPDDDAAWNNRGNALSALGRNEEAIANYDKAIEFKPDDDMAWNNRGAALYALGRHEEAIASYDNAIKFKPDKHEAWYSRGLVLSALGRYEEAIASYDKAIEFKPDYYKALYNRARLLCLIGQFDDALDGLEKSIALNRICRERAQTDEGFAALRDNERFRVLVS